jgi:hypothetical protein
MISKVILSLILTMGLITTLTAQKPEPNGDPELTKKIARFAPTTFTADVSKLSAKDRQALDKIIEAAKWMDPLFRIQVWAGNQELEKRLMADKTPAGRQRLHYFLINDGPWSRLDNNEPFIAGVPKEQPSGANYYPEDMTKDEFNSWLATLSEADKQKATGFFHLIRRGPDRKLTLVPYSQA